MAVNKVLWTVHMDTDAQEGLLKEHVLAAAINTVCIRTDSDRLPDLIGRFHKLGVKVWAWRWPGVIPDQGDNYYALDQALYVKNKLIPAGLDGYVVDPESDKRGPDDHKHDGNDWNQTRLADVARQFCKIINDSTVGKAFRLGVTSGCTFPMKNNKPDIPWKDFFTGCSGLYPQCYWRAMLRNEHTGKDEPTDLHGGSPTKAIANGFAAWAPLSGGKHIIPMAGEIDLVTPAEINEYGEQLKAHQINEAHFYADSKKVKSEVLAAIKAL